MAKEAGYDASRTVSHICPGPPSLQHLHLWPANHRLQKECIWCRSTNHACWWRLAGSGRAADQRCGNCRWIPPDLEATAQHYKNDVGNLHPNYKEAKRELKVKYNNHPSLLFRAYCEYLGVKSDRSLTYRRHLESLPKYLTSRIALLWRVAGSGWCAGATTLRIATLSLVHSTAEYCVPVWCRSAHTRLIADNLQNPRRHSLRFGILFCGE